MKIIKVLFIVALFNFFLIGGLILAMATFDQLKQKGVETKAVLLPTAYIISPTAEPPLPSETAKITQAAPSPTVSIEKPTIDNRCIITVEGQRYDVSQFRNKHDGGDVFVCGSDMTSLFRSQHSDEYLRKLNRYKL